MLCASSRRAMQRALIATARGPRAILPTGPETILERAKQRVVVNPVGIGSMDEIVERASFARPCPRARRLEGPLEQCQFLRATYRSLNKSTRRIAALRARRIATRPTPGDSLSKCTRIDREQSSSRSRDSTRRGRSRPAAAAGSRDGPSRARNRSSAQSRISPRPKSSRVRSENRGIRMPADLDMRTQHYHRARFWRD